MKEWMHATGFDSWQAKLSPHKLSHTNFWAYLTQGLTLLGNLCGLAAIIKEVAAALSQARKTMKILSPSLMAATWANLCIPQVAVGLPCGSSTPYALLVQYGCPGIECLTCIVYACIITHMSGQKA